MITTALGCEGILRVDFQSDNDLTDFLESPYKFAHHAQGLGASEMHFYVIGEDEPRVRTRVSGAIALGHRIGAI